MIERLKVHAFLMTLGVGTMVVGAVGPREDAGLPIISGFLIFLIGMALAGLAPKAPTRVMREALTEEITGRWLAHWRDVSWDSPIYLSLHTEDPLLRQHYEVKRRLNAMGAALDRMFR